MKSDPIRIRLTVNQEIKVLAFVITMLQSLYGSGTERVLRTVCEHFGFRLERKT